MLRIENPATEELIAELPEDSDDQVREKYAQAVAAQPAWAARALSERLDAIRKFQSLVREQQPRLAKLLSDEMGKPIQQANNELGALSGRIDFFLDHTARVLAEEVVQEGATEERIAWEPLGVVANISAWNYPYFVGSNVFVPALLTGNVVLYKPSEITALTGNSLAELLHASGVPAHAFQVIIGGGQAGRALLEQPIDGIFFTGSYATGRRIAEAVAGRMIRSQLELGGKDPAYVCDDADVKTAAEALADGAFYNAGQSCCSVERIYVHERVAQDFIRAFVEVVKGFVLGDPSDPKTYIGPLARKAQLRVLEGQVSDAVQRGAKLEIGGRRSARRGYYFEPTVLTDVNHGMSVMREESFGPIIGIQSVRSDEEAASLMNDTEYGLTAAVYGRDRERAASLLKRINSGSVYFNCCDRVSPRLPWTGRRHSGIGSTLSTHGIRAFVQPKAWHLRSA